MASQHIWLVLACSLRPWLHDSLLAGVLASIWGRRRKRLKRPRKKLSRSRSLHAGRNQVRKPVSFAAPCNPL